MGEKHSKAVILAMLSLLLILSFMGVFAAVNICPVEKKPTEMSITHSQLPKNEPMGIFSNSINVQIFLEWVDRTTGESGPLPGKNVTVTITILDKYLKKQSDGSFQIVSEESNFILPTDMDGKIDLTVAVDPFNPKKISYSITSDYIPVTKDAYIGSTANAKYTPTSMPLFSLAACLPLVIVLGMLMGAMYVSGRNPLGALDLSRAAFRVPGVERRAVKAMIKSTGSGLTKGVGGTLGDVVGRQAARFAAKTIQSVGGAALRGGIKTAWKAGKGIVKTTGMVGWGALKTTAVAGWGATKSGLTLVKFGGRATKSTRKELGSKKKESMKNSLKAMESMGVHPKVTDESVISAKNVAITAKTSIEGATRTAKESWQETYNELASSWSNTKGAFNYTVVGTWNSIKKGDLSVLGNLTGGERLQTIAARTSQARSMDRVIDRLSMDNPYSTTEVPEVSNALKKLKGYKDKNGKWVKIDEKAFELVASRAKSRAKEKGGDIRFAAARVRFAKKEMDKKSEEFEKNINKFKKEIGEAYAKDLISIVKKEISTPEGISKETAKKITDLITLKSLDSMSAPFSKLMEANNNLVLEKKGEKLLEDSYEAAKHYTSLLKKDPAKINQAYETPEVTKALKKFNEGKIDKKALDLIVSREGTNVTPAEGLALITSNEKARIAAQYERLEKQARAVYSAVNLRKDRDALGSLLEGNLSPKDNVERVKETLTGLLKMDLVKYVETEGAFSLIGLNAKKISWEETYTDAQGKQQTMIVNLPKEDAEKLAKGLKEIKFTTKLSEEVKVQGVDKEMLGKMGITGKSADKILEELNKEKSEIKSNISNALNTININAGDYLGYDFDKLRGGNVTSRMEQKLNELGISNQKDNILKFAGTSSRDSIEKLVRALGTPDAEVDKMVSEMTASSRMTRENGALLASFLGSRMTEGERDIKYSQMLGTLGEGKIEGMDKVLSDFVKKEGITTKDFEKYVDKLSDFTPEGYLKQGGSGYIIIDQLRSMSMQAADSGLVIPAIKVMSDPDKMYESEVPGVFKGLLSQLNRGELDANTAKIGSEAGMANMKRQAFNDTLDGNLIAPKVQAFGTAAEIKDTSENKIVKNISDVASSQNPKAREQIDNSLAEREASKISELAKKIADTSKELQTVEITRITSEKFTSKDNPLDKSVVGTSEIVKVYDENVNNTSELFQKVVIGDLDKWKPTESFEHKTLDGVYIDFKNEDLAKPRLTALVASAIQNDAAYEVISDKEIRFKDVSIRVDKDKLYIIKKRTLIDINKNFSKLGSDTSASV